MFKSFLYIKFNKHCINYWTLALEAICPPVATALLVLELSSYGASVGSATLGGIKTASEYFSNKEFNEQKVIDELKLEEDSD